MKIKSFIFGYLAIFALLVVGLVISLASVKNEVVIESDAVFASGCWGINGECDNNCNSKTYTKTIAGSQCIIEKCQVAIKEYRTPSGGLPCGGNYNDYRCFANNYITYFSNRDCKGDTIGYQSGGICNNINCNNTNSPCFQLSPPKDTDLVARLVSSKPYTFETCRQKEGTWYTEPLPDGSMNDTTFSVPLSDSVTVLNCVDVDNSTGIKRVSSQDTTGYLPGKNCSHDGSGSCYKLSNTKQLFFQPSNYSKCSLSNDRSVLNSTCNSSKVATKIETCTWISAISNETNTVQVEKQTKGSDKNGTVKKRATTKTNFSNTQRTVIKLTAMTNKQLRTLRKAITAELKRRKEPVE